MDTDVVKTRKKIQIVPKARKAFQKTPGGQALPQDQVTKARKKFEKLVITNNLVESNDGEYCQFFLKKSVNGRLQDSKFNGGSNCLRWTVLNDVHRLFFFGDGLLCLVNGCFVQIVDDLLKEPTCQSFNLLSRRVMTATSDIEKENQHSGVQFVVGCPHTPLIAFAKEKSSTVYLIIYPKMTCVAALKSHTSESSSYIGLDFGLGEYLYALRGQPDSSVEIWNTGSLSLLTMIPGAYYTNDIVFRTSLLNNNMVILDRGSQCAIMWALHDTSPSDLYVCPKAVQMPPKLDSQLVDVAHSFDGDLYLLSEKGRIYFVEENKEGILCDLVENNEVYHRLLESRLKSDFEEKSVVWASLFWCSDCFFAHSTSQKVLAKYKILNRMKLELLDTFPIDDGARVAVDNLSGVFKADNSFNCRMTLAVWGRNGLKLMKPKSQKLNEILVVPGCSRDFSFVDGHVIIGEKHSLRCVRIEDGSLVSVIPMRQDVHRVLVHPRMEFFVVSERKNGSLLLFQIKNHEVRFIEKFQLFDHPIELMAFSLRGDALVIGTQMGNIGLLLADKEGLMHPVTIMTAEHEINSLSFMTGEEGSLLLAAVSNGSDGSTVIYFYGVPTLSRKGIVALSQPLYQIAESRLKNVIYGTALSGLAAFVFSFTSRKGTIHLQKTEIVEYYDQECWRSLLSNWNSLVIYGGDGRLEIFSQSDGLRRIHTTQTSSRNGFIRLSICSKMKFVVGLMHSGVMICRSLKLSSRVKDMSEFTSPPISGSGAEYFDEEGVGFGKSARKLFEDSLEQEAANLKNEGLAYKFIQRHLISTMRNILEEIAPLEESMSSLNLNYQEELKGTFLNHVSTRNLLAIKHRNLKKLYRKKTEDIIQVTEEVRNILDSYSKRYSDVFDHQDASTAHLNDCKEYTPTLIKDNLEIVYNFYNSAASVIQEPTIDHVLLYCSDNITVSSGFDKYLSPRWLRNAGPGAEVLSLTVHSRKKKDADGDEKPKFDLNRKITEAVANLSSYFLKKRELEEQCNLVEEGTNDDDKAEASLPQMKIVDSTKPSTECFLASEDKTDETAGESRSSVATSVNSDESPEVIFEASNDGTEEECISSASMSSGASYEMEPSGEWQRGPGEHSNYLIKLLELKEAKKTEKFELKDGILKYYHQLPENIKGFTKKFHGSSSHVFLHAFPLCFCSDEMESTLINCVQFCYSRYFVEALREHFNAVFEEHKMAEELSTMRGTTL